VRVVVTEDGVEASFDVSSLLVGSRDDAANQCFALAVPTSSANYGHEPRLRLDPPAGATTPRDERLEELIIRAFATRDRLLAMSAHEVASTPAVSLRHLELVARLSYLDSVIVRSILDGIQPRTLSARHLSRMGALPVSWAEQRNALGFAPD
jgi:hypothetical protein